MMDNATIHIFGVFISIMITIILFYIKSISKRVNDIDDKLFKHLTNDELHSPRSIVAYKAECAIFQQFLNKNLDDMKDRMNSIFKILDKMKG